MQRFLSSEGTEGLVEDGHWQTRPFANEVFEDMVVDECAAEESEIRVVEAGVLVGRGDDEGAGESLQRDLVGEG
jgi:hypothetical protein